MENKEYKLAEQLIKEDMFLISEIYIDIEFLKYIKLGDILAHEKLTADVYTGVTNIISDSTFTSRHTNDPSVLFKSVQNIQTVLIPSIVTDDARFRMSPSYDNAVELINAHITKSDNSRKILNQPINNTITIDVSIYPDISDGLCNQIATEYANIFGTKVVVLKKGLSSLSAAKLKFDAFYVGDLAKFNAIMLEHLNNESLTNKYFFCSKVLPLSRLDNVNDENIDITFVNIDLVMSAASKFQFVQPFTCLR